MSTFSGDILVRLLLELCGVPFLQLDTGLSSRSEIGVFLLVDLRLGKETLGDFGLGDLFLDLLLVVLGVFCGGEEAFGLGVLPLGLGVF